MARLFEWLLWGGYLRERFIVWLLGRHYRSVFRRKWVLAEQPPHFFDHRIGSFELATGQGSPYTYYRGYFAAELVEQGDRLLDIGCGDGFFTKRFFAPRCSRVDAIDIEPSAIAHANRFNAATNVAYHLLDAVNEPFPETKYEVVVWDGALGHFAAETTERMLAKIGASLAPDGAFVGSESLGQEGSDHLQFFGSTDDLCAIFKRHFEHVEVRSIEYEIGGGTIRREAFWRCAHEPARLARAAWKGC